MYAVELATESPQPSPSLSLSLSPLLTGERTNVYQVLVRHFAETALPPSERFWRAVRSHWAPPLDTWRPRVNGVQLKVGGGRGREQSQCMLNGSPRTTAAGPV